MPTNLQQTDNRVEIPTDGVNSFQEQTLVKGLKAVAAGFAAGSAKPMELQRVVPAEALFMYCVRGSGWCEASGFLNAFRQGDFVVVPPRVAYSCRTRPSRSWAIHWARATGDLIPDYLASLGSVAGSRVHHVGDNLELARLFNETLCSLNRGVDFPNVLRASHALSHMLAVLVERRRESSARDHSTPQKVAEAIIYMSEHVHEPVRISALARLANLAPTYFTGLFKQQTGCAPRDYLHLLRIHRACQLLSGTRLSIKQIASQIGYQDQFHFSRQFKAFQGISPTEYRGVAQAKPTGI